MFEEVETEKCKLYDSFLWWKYWFYCHLKRVWLFKFELTLSIALKHNPSQDTDGIKSTIKKALDDIGMPELKHRMLFLASDSVNSWLKQGLQPNFMRMVLAVCLVYVSSIRIGFKK